MPSSVRHLPRLGMSAAMRIFGMTARALRFYEERGLVSARRDRLNVRYFDAVARGRLEWIARLRRADISIPDIKRVLEAEDRATRCARAVEVLHRRRDRVLRHLEAIDAALMETKGEAQPYEASGKASPG
jgi:DNA-binding transcriptional MerR regulator